MDPQQRHKRQFSRQPGKARRDIPERNEQAIRLSVNWMPNNANGSMSP